MESDESYFSTFITPVRKCSEYRPKFGTSNRSGGLSRNDFLSLYGNDPFYSWLGFDSDLMYAAHRAAGGMTSVYRQVGIGCERLFRKIIIDCTKYSDKSFAQWSYQAQASSGKTKTLSLDGRLELSEIKVKDVKSRVEDWIKNYISEFDGVQEPKNGVVFEVRQGYKSKDSKRQNADIDNATVGWAHGYLPVFAIFSSQIDTDIVLRYKNNRCGVLTGLSEGDSRNSLFVFSSEVLGYDLAGFFVRNSEKIKSEVHQILHTLLSAQ